ncbi:MAG: hypothetical protein DWI57_00110 [Chloroflexi bacterium]|nr:MAG: hypothetical protein DWI57_00110 [Chloroflexota bacterium]
MHSIVLTSEQTSESPLLLHLHLEAMLRISGEQARLAVNRQVVPMLGTGLIARTAELAVTGEEIGWRVPVSLSLPSLGDLGQIGCVVVDARTGDIQLKDTDRERLVRHARHLYRGATLSAE